jgi:hypothetical protein
MPAFLSRLAQLLRPGGRALLTFPMAYGQIRSVVGPGNQGEVLIPGWEILGQARDSGFNNAVVHLVASWKHGVLASNLPGVLVMELVR